MTSYPRLLHTVLDTTDCRGLAEFYRELLGLQYRHGDEPPTDGPDDADWLVLVDLTHHSGLAVGITSALQYLPMLLLSAQAGVIADRLPKRRLLEVLNRYPHADDVRWVQEEPANQGAWPFLGLALPEQCPERLSHVKRVSRRRMAAPAAGSPRVHEVEQREILAKAFD